MIYRQKMILLFSVMLSKRIMFIFLAVVAVILLFMLPYGDIITENAPGRLFGRNFFKKRSRNREELSRVSWISQKRHDARKSLVDFDERLSTKKRSAIRKREEKLIKEHLIKQKRYISNYTRCLLTRFAKLGENLFDARQRFAMSFKEIMGTLHGICNVEIFGKKENQCQSTNLGKCRI